ncbi:MAG: DUF2024 domain-containing protein [Candidatus Brocadia sp.]|jgi:Domain of unknown function (DUF2024).|uniref:DUF2024 domain-containing protein n=1 Tax=Candidatus Brocadia fulgida TaxID=380242 RepID=A0A0M2UY13_9BACT|nr:MAG: hypothetical protein BROFUL_01420 [Candidatus Brocadia fulgida]MCC6325866.1 DUF2024 family protein [Candidatus Brocadia sp.]MCE7910387.1 DUF2024 family protein [Candidatus Brocadia sp. AMX3]OQZ02595.1 MAG: hypothetical protein B6D35_00740 [Candidatus Brocadia sp. UTAMX2]MBV6517897.1 hypothetical protein [Candidatus Brocadia fulgida]
MKVAVYDTYVVKKNGVTMHFDIIVPKEQSHEKAIQYGLEYLKRVGQEGQPLTTQECRFCHTENASENVKKVIEDSGYYIHEMEGCK